MKFLELTLSAPAANIACDEALLELLDDGPDPVECLRIWEPANYFVVLGHANRMAEHVNVSACRATGVPILRRMSGGGTVVQGPGCLNYAVTLRMAGQRSIADLYRLVLDRHCAVLSELCGRQARVAGISDLAVDGLKCSGNAQYRKARSVLVHGTFLLRFDVAWIERLLPIPARQPAYRKNRPHHEFVTNLDLDKKALVRALQRAWEVRETFARLPMERIDSLIRERYGTVAWSEKF